MTGILIEYPDEVNENEISLDAHERFGYFQSMNDTDYQRHLYLPPEGRPRWKAQTTTDWDLLYLFWGLRWFGENPVPLSRREGWSYITIIEGTPTFLFDNGKTLKTRPGMVIIVHPDCVRGTLDRPGRQCQELGWIWKTQPSHPLLQPRPGKHLTTMLPEEVLHQLGKIHAACRKEVAFPSGTSRLALQKYRLELDLCLLHALDKPESASQDDRITLAIEFLRHNPRVMDPVKQLCEYLMVSPATLKRLFKTYFGQSPQAFALDQRMRLAREMLASGQKMVKEVAFELGYKHPNNFSRTYNRFLHKKT